MVKQFCDQCGEPLGTNARFCAGCGASVSEPSESATQAEPSTPIAAGTPQPSEGSSSADASELSPGRASSKSILSILFDGSGKSSQGQFALVILPHVAIGVTFRALSSVSDAFALVALLYWLPGVYIAFIAVVRRFHDMGKSGWWSLLMLVPLVNFVTLIVLLFSSGQTVESEEVTCPECHLLSPHHLETCTVRNL